MRQRYLTGSLCGAALVLVLLAGCEEEVTAVLGTEEPFTLYGVLMPEAERQYVRVFPVENRLEPARPEPLDARFTSTDLETGEVRVWRDSLLQEEDGRYTHAFWSPFRVAQGRTYHLEVTRSDGAVTQVEVPVPPPVELLPQAPILDENHPTWLPGTIPILARDAPFLRDIKVHYRCEFAPDYSEQFVISYDNVKRQTDGTWVVPISLYFDKRTIQAIAEQYNFYGQEYGIVLLEVRLTMSVVNEGWDPPGGAFDAEVLAQPGVLENVENGFGFVGAGYHLNETLSPSVEAIEAAGFRTR